TTALYTLSLHDALPILAARNFTSMGLSLRTPGNSQRIFAIWASRRTRWKSSKSARLVLQPNTADQAAASSVLLSSPAPTSFTVRSEEHTSELQSRFDLV